MEQTHFITAAQGDGADRPFNTNGATEPVLVHTEKSGPAFRGQLEASLQAQALKKAGDVLIALRSRELQNVIRTWPRLLAVVDVRSLGARRFPRQSWAWIEMTEAVEAAMFYAEQPGQLKWQYADALIRGYALECAMGIESRLDRQDISADSLRSAETADAFRTFAEGK